MKKGSTPSRIIIPTEDEVRKLGNSTSGSRDDPKRILIVGNMKNTRLRVGNSGIVTSETEFESQEVVSIHSSDREIRSGEMNNFDVDILDPNSLEVTETYATARTDLCLSEWSPYFVHGSDLILAAKKLANAVVSSDEKIIGIDKMNMRERLVHNLQLHACIGNPQGCVNMPKGEKPVVEVVFFTGEGKKIYVHGFKTESLVSDRLTKHNPIALKSFNVDPQNSKIDRGEHGMTNYKDPLHKLRGAREYLEGNPDMILPTIYDIISADLSVNVRESSGMPKYGNAIGGIRDFAPPPLSIFDGQHFIIVNVPSHEKLIKNEKGFKTFPVTVSFADRNGEPVYSATLYLTGCDRYEDSERMIHEHLKRAGHEFRSRCFRAISGLIGEWTF